MEMKSKKYTDINGNSYWITKEPYSLTSKGFSVYGPFVTCDDQPLEINELAVYGKLHRLDGPAVQLAAPLDKQWWAINGKKYENFQAYARDVKLLISAQEYYIMLLKYGT